MAADSGGNYSVIFFVMEISVKGVVLSVIYLFLAALLRR